MNRTIPFIVKWICSVFLLISSLQDILYNFSIILILVLNQKIIIHATCTIITLHRTFSYSRNRQNPTPNITENRKT